MSNSGPGCFHVGDYGLTIVACLDTDLTELTSATFRVEKPSGSKLTWPCELRGSDQLRYTILSGDFNEPGDYRIQVRLVFPDAVLWSTTDVFTVEEVVI